MGRALGPEVPYASWEATNSPVGQALGPHKVLGVLSGDGQLC